MNRLLHDKERSSGPRYRKTKCDMLREWSFAPQPKPDLLLLRPERYHRLAFATFPRVDACFPEYSEREMRDLFYVYLGIVPRIKKSFPFLSRAEPSRRL